MHNFTLHIANNFVHCVYMSVFFYIFVCVVYYLFFFYHFCGEINNIDNLYLFTSMSGSKETNSIIRIKENNLISLTTCIH